MVRVQCPHCQRTFRTRMEAFGRTAVCTRCTQSFKIGDARPSFEWKPTGIAEDSWIGVEAPVEKKELRHCIMCEAALEPDSVSCPACGANQVTGVMHRPAPKPVTDQRRILPVIPLRLVVMICIFGAIALGGYWAILAITRSASQVTDELVDQGVGSKAARFIRDGGDEYTFSDRFSGRVTDENLPRFIKMLSSTEASIRQAAALLIGCGQVTRLDPLIAAARDKAGDEACRALHAIGARRLVEMSGTGEEASRRAAAEGLCLLNRVPTTPENLAMLSRPEPAAEKTQHLNALCRPWPEAIGPFAVLIKDKPAPFTVQIEQVGRVFYLRVNRTEFHTTWSPQKEALPLPRFSIPVARWCLATGASYDLASMEELFGGSLALGSNSGVGWEGTVRVMGRQDLTSELPGFLPLPAPARGENVSAPVRLQRP